MLQPQQTLNLSPYGHLYDLLIPKDDELRRIHDEIDMSFVYTELVKNYCDDNGRTAEDPIRMFRGKDGSGVVTTERPPDGFETDPTPLAAQGTEQRGAGVKEAQNGRHQDCSPLELCSLGLSKNLEGAERTRKKQAACRRAHRPSGQPTTREEPRGKATWWHSLARKRGKARAAPPPALPIREGALRIVGKPQRGCPQDQVPQSLTA